MEPAKKPKNEERRLEQLRLYQVLDTPPEEAFDRITKIVSSVIGVPIALVSLVDEDRQWFKSKVGLDASETPRDLAFCAHAILGEETFVVEDASKDIRFHDNPLVASDPSIRFYAGTPLTTSDGANLGTLCAIDREPRKLTEDQQELLENLSKLVIDEMELRLALQSAMKIAADEAQLREKHDDFVANVSHELRTPLTSISGTLKLLEAGVGGDLPEKASDLVRIATRNSEDLLSLVNDLLDIQSLEKGSMSFDFSAVDVCQIVTETCEKLHGYAVKKNVMIEVNCCEASVLVADKDRLAQAIKNLLSNAIKFSPDDGIVMVDMHRSEKNLEVAVTDKGSGIPPEFEAQLFSRFSQAKTGKKPKGTGLGLAITKSIIDAHNGSISVNTAVGKGSKFTLTLPLSQSIRKLAEQSN